jgi:hypothetical protein
MSMKTEHAGAKNGGGWRGRRKEAKALSRIQRRLNDKALVKSGMQECPDCPDPEVHEIEGIFQVALAAAGWEVEMKVIRLLADVARYTLGAAIPRDPPPIADK